MSTGAAQSQFASRGRSARGGGSDDLEEDDGGLRRLAEAGRGGRERGEGRERSTRARGAYHHDEVWMVTDGTISAPCTCIFGCVFCFVSVGWHLGGRVGALYLCVFSKQMNYERQCSRLYRSLALQLRRSFDLYWFNDLRWIPPRHPLASL